MRPPIVSSVMGLYPPEFVGRLKQRGIAWFANISTVAEARALLDAHPEIYAFTRTLDDTRLLVILNFSKETPLFELPADLPVSGSELLIANYAVVPGEDIRPAAELTGPAPYLSTLLVPGRRTRRGCKL